MTSEYFFQKETEKSKLIDDTGTVHDEKVVCKKFECNQVICIGD